MNNYVLVDSDNVASWSLPQKCTTNLSVLTRQQLTYCTVYKNT